MLGRSPGGSQGSAKIVAAPESFLRQSNSDSSVLQDVPEAPFMRPGEEDAESILCMNAFMRATEHASG
jgi:hypothetical protein